MSEIVFIEPSELSLTRRYDFGVKFEKLLAHTPKNEKKRRKGLLHTAGLKRSSSYFGDNVLQVQGTKVQEGRRNIVAIESTDGELNPDSLLGLVTLTWVKATYSERKKDNPKFVFEGYSIDGFSNNPDDPVASTLRLYSAGLGRVRCRGALQVAAFEPAARDGMSVGGNSQVQLNNGLVQIFENSAVLEQPFHVERSILDQRRISSFAYMISTSKPIDI